MNPAQFLNGLFSLRDRIAYVTGGSSGIGGALAQGFAQAGAKVVITARNSEALHRATARIKALGCEAAAVQGDLADRAQIARIIDEVIDHFGEPDILVTSAGINLRPPMEALTMKEWDHTLALNLTTPFLLGQHFGPAMATRGWGRIIHIASQQAIRAFGNSGAYGVSKAGISALVRSQAEAWSSRGVCVNALGPSFVETPLTSAVFSDPKRAATMAARTMVGRNGLPKDYLGMALTLASSAGSYITGQTIFVDGGFSSK